MLRLGFKRGTTLLTADEFEGVEQPTALTKSVMSKRVIIPLLEFLLLSVFVVFIVICLISLGRANPFLCLKWTKNDRFDAF